MQTATTTSLQVAPCVVADRVFCFDAKRILGMLDSKTCEGNQDACSDDKSIGTIDFKGDQIHVYDLCDLLNLTPESDTEHGGVVVVVATASGPRGFVVDDALRTRAPQRLIPLPLACRNTEAPLFDGIAIWDGGKSIAETQEEVALRLCPDGLSGNATTITPSFTEEPVDVREFTHIVGNRKRQMMLFDVPHQDWKNQIVSVGLSVTQVLEIITPQLLMEIPRTEGTAGIIRWRDCFVPIVDLTQKLTMGSIPEEARHRIVIARDAKNLFAFYTSASVRTLAKPLSDAKEIDMGSISQSKWAKGTFSVHDDLVVLPNLAV